MKDIIQSHRNLASGRMIVLLSFSLVTMIGCQANQPNTKAVPAELREGMWQGELEQLMRSRGVVLIGTRNLGAGAGGQARDYRFGNKVLRVSLGYPVIRPNEEWRPERYVDDWKFVDLEAEKRQEKLAEKEWDETWGKMDLDTLTRTIEEGSYVTGKGVSPELYKQYWPERAPNAKGRPTSQPGSPAGNR